MNHPTTPTFLGPDDATHALTDGNKPGAAFEYTDSNIVFNRPADGYRSIYTRTNGSLPQEPRHWRGWFLPAGTTPKPV